MNRFENSEAILNGPITDGEREEQISFFDLWTEEA